MKKDNINYFAVGVFILIILTVLFAMFYRVTGQVAGAEDYYVVFDNVAGIKRGTAVTYSGFPIGQLDDVQPLVDAGKTRYKLHLQIKGGWKIPEDSIAQIIMPGVIADRQIEITEGKSQILLQPGATISSRETVDLMTLVNSIGNELDTSIVSLTGDASVLIKKLDNTADQLAVLLNDANRTHLNNAFRNADEASENMLKLSQGFASINTRLEDVLRRADNLLQDNDADVRQTVIDLHRSVESVTTNMDAILYNLDASSRNMNEFTRQLRNNPGVLLGSKPAVDLVEEQK
ncbi:MAG TPA: MlaD family protein [Gammaproteobacteria bacterium]|nr:MlaD family protein [Gammaproteobacteria bacterium]